VRTADDRRSYTEIEKLRPTVWLLEQVFNWKDLKAASTGNPLADVWPQP
jgi:hypothetical protein